MMSRGQGYKSDYALSLQFIRPPHHCRFRDRRVAYQRAFDFHGPNAVPRHVDNVIDPAHDPQITVFVAAGTVTREVDARNFAPVLLFISFGVTVNGSKHRRPRFFDDEESA